MSAPARIFAGVVCLSCRLVTSGALCSGCEAHLQTGPDRLLAGALRVRAAFLHRGPARALVHNFKYRGIEPAGRYLAEAMAPLLPPGVLLVPLPRVGWRLLRYGIDPAKELAANLSHLTGLPVASLLSAPLFSRSQAQMSRSERQAPMFNLRRSSSGPLVLIDDVVTTGGTLASARRVLGSVVVMALTATATAR